MRNRREQSRAQLLRLHRLADALHVGDEIDAFDGNRSLIAQGIEQPALIGREDRALPVAVDADHPDRAAARAHRQEQSPRARQGIGAPTGGAIAFERPFRRRQIGLLEEVLGRVGPLDFETLGAGQQQHHAHFEHAGDLERHGPEHIVERADPRELLAERVKLVGRSRPCRRGNGLRPPPGGNVRDNHRHHDEKEEGGDIVGVGDGESIKRGQQEEIEGQRRHHAGEQRGPKAVTRGDSHHGGQEYEVGAAATEPRLPRESRCQGDSHCEEGRHIGLPAELRFDGCYEARRRTGFRLLARDHMDADVARLADQLVHHRSVQQLEPERPRRFADDDVGDVVGLRMGDQVFGDRPTGVGKRHRFAAEALGKAHGIRNTVALVLTELRAPSALHINCGPGRMQAIGETLGVPHQSGTAGVLTDADQHPLSRPRTGDGPRLHLRQQLLVNAFGGPPQGQFAQRRQIGRREELLEGPRRLIGDVDLALLEALNQVLGREVDEFHGIGAGKDGVGHRLAHPDVGDLRHHIVETLHMLNVDGGVDVDAVVQQLEYVLITLGVATAGRVGMGQFVDDREPGMTRDQPVEVHVVKPLALVLDAATRKHGKALDEGLRFLATVRLDNADDDVDAVRFLGLRGLQHGIGLADPWCGADKNSEPAV